MGTVTQLTNDQIDTIMSHLEDNELFDDAKKEELIEHYNALRTENSKEINFATEEELDSIMGSTWAGTVTSKTKTTPKSSTDKILDEICKFI